MPQELTRESLERALDGVLAEAPFSESAEPSLLERWMDRALDWWSDLGLSLPDVDQHPWMTPAAGLVLAVAALWLAWQARRFWRRPDPNRRRLRVAVRAEDEHQPEDELSAARRALSAGDTRTAIEHLWQSVAAFASSSGRSGLTPRGTLRQMQASIGPELRLSFAEVLGAHERACYAGHVPSTPEVERLIASIGPALGQPTALAAVPDSEPR